MKLQGFKNLCLTGKKRTGHSSNGKKQKNQISGKCLQPWIKA